MTRYFNFYGDYFPFLNLNQIRGLRLNITMELKRCLWVYYLKIAANWWNGPCPLSRKNYMSRKVTVQTGQFMNGANKQF